MHVKQGLTLPMLLLILMGLLMGVQVQWPNAMVRATTVIVLLFSSAFSSVVQPIPPEEGIWDARWNPDGTLLAVANPGGQIYIYGPNRELLRTFPGHEKRATAVTWSPDGKVIASSGWDTFIRFWDVETGTLLHEIDIPWGSAYTLDWQSNGHNLVAAGFDTVQVWDTSTYQPVTMGAGVSILDMEWGPDGSCFAYGATSGSGIATIQEDRFVNLRFMIGAEPANMRTSSVSWSSDGTQIASTHDKEGVYIWNASTGEMKYRVYKSDETFYDAIFVGEASEQIVAITQEGRIYTFAAATGEIVETLETEAFLWSIAWNPTFNLVAIGGTSSDLNRTRATDVKTTGFLSLHPITTSETRD